MAEGIAARRRPKHLGARLVRAVASPLWRKAPLMLVRHPGLLAGLTVASAVLAIAAASAPLFLSSATTAALREHARFTSSALGGLVVKQEYTKGVRGKTLTATNRDNDRALRAALPDAPLEDRIVTVFNEARLGAPGDARLPIISLLMSRTGATNHIDIVAGEPGEGILISVSQADRLGLGVGDDVMIGGFAGRTTARIDGIYEDLAFERPTNYWQPLHEEIYGQGETFPPAFVLGSSSAFTEINSVINRDFAATQWEFPLDRSSVTVHAAIGLKDTVDGVRKRLSDERGELPRELLHTWFGFAFDHRLPSRDTVLGDLISSARETVSGITGSVLFMSAAGVVVGLVMIGAVEVFLIRRRRTEAALLAARGLAPAAYGAKAAVEAAVPLAAGTVMGWFTAIWIITRFGPSEALEPNALRLAAAAAAFGAIVGLGTIFAVAAVAESRTWAASLSGFSMRAARSPWEVVLLILAAGAYFLGRGRPGPGDGSSPLDVMMLVFPVLLIAGGAGLAVRGLARALPSLRSRGGRLPAAAYLALRRLRDATRVALVLAAAAAFALGIFTYSGALIASEEVTAGAKAHMSTGSDVAARLETGAVVPRDTAFDSTVVHRYALQSVSPGDLQVAFMLIEPATFADAAYSGPGSAGSLEELIERLEHPSGGALPVVVAGEPVAAGSSLELFSARLPLEQVANVDAFPGMVATIPTLVTTMPALRRFTEQTGISTAATDRWRELWAEGEPKLILDELERRNIGVTTVVTADRARRTPALASSGWTLALLRVIGAATVVIVLAGLVVYMQARQRTAVVSFALARRMGLRGKTFRRSVSLELGVLLLGSLTIGAVLSLVAARLVHSRLDFYPDLPPEPIFSMSLPIVAGAALVLVVAAAAGAWAIQRAAERANVAEVFRLAE